MTGERMLLAGRALPPGGRSVRALLLLGSIVLLLIVGLLGMHALGSSTAGHGASATTPVASAQHASVHAAAGHVAEHPKPTPAADEAPADPGHEHSVLMACVLALLAGLIVLARPSMALRSWLEALLRPRSLRPPAARASLPPPSLLLLSISRT